MLNIDRRRFATLLAAAATVPSGLHAQDSFPARPLRLIVPWPPGGGVDTFGRVVQAPLAEALGQTIVVDNIGGGSGRVGTQTAARATPDGYTILLANDTFAATEALPVAGTTSLRSAFTPVTLAISGPQGVFTHPRSGFQDDRGFHRRRARRGPCVESRVPGIGSSQHLASGCFCTPRATPRRLTCPIAAAGLFCRI